MKNYALMTCGLALALAGNAAGQDKLQMVLAGTCSTTDKNGRILQYPVNNRSLVEEYARGAGITNSSQLALAYHLHGNDLGDTIDVIKWKDGTVVHTLFGLYFGEDFNRLALLSASGEQMKRIEYVYTDQNSHSVGSALMTDYFYLDGNGQTNKTIVLGQMQWLTLGDTVHTNVSVCHATFATRRPWTFGSNTP